MDSCRMKNILGQRFPNSFKQVGKVISIKGWTETRRSVPVVLQRLRHHRNHGAFPILRGGGFALDQGRVWDRESVGGQQPLLQTTTELKFNLFHDQSTLLVQQKFTCGTAITVMLSGTPITEPFSLREKVQFSFSMMSCNPVWEPLFQGTTGWLLKIDRQVTSRCFEQFLYYKPCLFSHPTEAQNNFFLKYTVQ